MAERYVDQAQFSAVCYTDRLAQTFEVEEAWCVNAGVGSLIDTYQLVNDVEDHLAPENFYLEDRWSHFSWGADASSWQLIVEIAEVLGGASGVAALILSMADRIGHKTVPSDAEQAGATAARALANLSHIRLEDVGVEEINPLPNGGFEVFLKAKRRNYSAVIGPEGLWRIQKVKTQRGGGKNESS